MIFFASLHWREITRFEEIDGGIDLWGPIEKGNLDGYVWNLCPSVLAVNVAQVRTFMLLERIAEGKQFHSTCQKLCYIIVRPWSLTQEY
jgi:hypothetical protein